MKKILFFLSLSLAVFFVACTKDIPTEIVTTTDVQAFSTPIDPADLPQAILDYIAANYPDATITEAEQETEDGNIVYEVNLNSGEELIFAPDGTLLAVGSNDGNEGDTDNDGTQISLGDLPQAIIEYIATNYPDAVIIFAELEFDGTYEVYLGNGIELHFDANGVFVSMSDDNDDDGAGDNDDDNDVDGDDDDNGDDDDGDGIDDDGIAGNDNDDDNDDNGDDDDGDGINDDGIADNDNDDDNDDDNDVDGDDDDGINDDDNDDESDDDDGDGINDDGIADNDEG